MYAFKNRKNYDSYNPAISVSDLLYYNYKEKGRKTQKKYQSSKQFIYTHMQHWKTKEMQKKKILKIINNITTTITIVRVRYKKKNSLKVKITTTTITKRNYISNNNKTQ